MHPARAASLAQSNPSNETSAKPQLLSPEEDAARKARINNDMIYLSKRPCPVNSNPSIQGIGLYTHVAAPTLGNSSPVFLPIGGPNRATKDGTYPEPPISEQVDLAWRHVQAAVNDAEKQSGQGGMGIDKLKERYGALDSPEQKAVTTQHAQLRAQLQRVQELARKIEKDRAQKAAIRQASTVVGQQTADTIMGGTHRAVGAITAPTRTNTTTSISEYHENEDPRRRRR
jgi:hypothetical protein